MVSGDQDPVGDFGKGVKKVYRRLVKTGHDVQLILYPGGRHEILNETNRDQVYRAFSVAPWRGYYAKEAYPSVKNQDHP